MSTMLDAIINQEVKQDDVLFSLEKEILETDKPNVWNIWKKGNMERVLEVDFQKFALSVTSKIGQKLEDLSTFTFFASVEHLTEVHSKK